MTKVHSGKISTFLPTQHYPLFHVLYPPTVLQNSQESGHKYWATCSSVLTFACTAHSLTPELVGEHMIRCLKFPGLVPQCHPKSTPNSIYFIQPQLPPTLFTSSNPNNPCFYSLQPRILFTSSNPNNPLFCLLHPTPTTSNSIHFNPNNPRFQKLHFLLKAGEKCDVSRGKHVRREKKANFFAKKGKKEKREKLHRRSSHLHLRCGKKRKMECTVVQNRKKVVQDSLMSQHQNTHFPTGSVVS